MQASLTTLAGLISLASAHGSFDTPIARLPGDEYAVACGAQAYSMMSSDINGNIQGLQQLVATQTDYNAEECDLWLCKGMKYADNTDRVQSYSAGQEIDMYFAIRAPHSGYANVSIVSTSTNTILSSTLKQWDEYALTSEPMRADWQNFTITMPTDLGEACATAGECVIQMHWNAPPPVDQTYQSCVDFTLEGGAAGNASVKRSYARSFAG